MSVKNPDFEREHPRNPEDGQFVDKTGSSGWAGKLAGMVGQGHGHVGPVDPAVQQRREDVLEALNPEAAFRRKAEPLLRTIFAPILDGVDPEITDDQIESYIRESLTGGPRLTAPITDEHLDDMLMNILSLEDEAGYQAMDDGLTRVPDWSTRFPGTYERITDFFEHQDSEDY